MTIRGIVWEKVESTFSYTNYAISGSLVIGDAMQYLDSHAAAFGVILGFMTFLTQITFSALRYRAYKKAIVKNPLNDD